MDKQSGSQDLTFLAGGGEMGDRIRAFDWSRTPLGSPERWPQSLRSVLSMLLPSKAQMGLNSSFSTTMLIAPSSGRSTRRCSVCHRGGRAAVEGRLPAPG